MQSVENAFAPPQSPCRPDRDERRVMCRALLRWEILRDEDRLPLDGSLNLAEDADLAPHFYVVRLQPTVAASVFERCGDELATLCPRYRDGASLREVLPAAVRERIVDFMHSAATYRQPLADSGDFPGRDGRDVQYRNIVMPMQDASGAVVSIVGAFSYRTVP